MLIPIGFGIGAFIMLLAVAIGYIGATQDNT